jgi:N-acetylmuramic acid 6-phosphate etherase
LAVTPDVGWKERTNASLDKAAALLFDSRFMSSVTQILGIEGGGTRTTWALLTGDERVVKRGEVGPGNTLLLDDNALEKLLRGIRREAGADIAAIGGAFAGCQRPAEQARVEKIMRRVWPKTATLRAMEDTSSILSAAFGDGPGLIVIAGTGSNVAGHRSSGNPLEKAGGWGHLFSDRGSAYDLARRGLEQAFRRYDEGKKISVLAREYLAATGAATMEELVSFSLRDTNKTTVAKGARCVFSAAQKGDRDARALIDAAAAALAENVATVAKRLRLAAPQVALTGGLFENRPEYLQSFRRALRRSCPRAKAFLATVPGVVGAARLAGKARHAGASNVAGMKAISSEPVREKEKAPDPARLAAYAKAATEQRNPRSRGLDKRSIAQLVDLFIREERYVENALRAQRREIARAATLISKRLGAGGRLFYVGAGTSGRLGVVDASEMPPTFNAPPEQIQALIAGGPAAVFQSQEGAEDSREAGAAELRARGLTKKDVLCGIAASGQTPYVLGGLEYARKLGAGTILLSCNPERVMRVPVDVAIDLPTGPEIVTGSTRLKAGTATKLVLNMLSTIAMVRLGRVQDNWMVNVQATNDKLRARAVRLVQSLTGVGEIAAREALEESAWRVPAAAVKLKTSKRRLRA